MKVLEWGYAPGCSECFFDCFDPCWVWFPATHAFAEHRLWPFSEFDVCPAAGARVCVLAGVLSTWFVFGAAGVAVVVPVFPVHEDHCWGFDLWVVRGFYGGFGDVPEVVWGLPVLVEEVHELVGSPVVGAEHGQEVGEGDGLLLGDHSFWSSISFVVRRGASRYVSERSTIFFLGSFN